eukprot:3140601-Rhodomonas_salina.2
MQPPAMKHTVSLNGQLPILWSKPAHACQVLEVVPDSRRVRSGWLESWWPLSQKEVSKLDTATL